jgi:hypothetical protein
VWGLGERVPRLPDSLPIDFSSMPDINHKNQQFLVVYFVDDTVCADAETLCGSPG